MGIKKVTLLSESKSVKKLLECPVCGEYQEIRARACNLFCVTVFSTHSITCPDIPVEIDSWQVSSF